MADLEAEMARFLAEVQGPPHQQQHGAPSFRPPPQMNYGNQPQPGPNSFQQPFGNGPSPRMPPPNFSAPPGPGMHIPHPQMQPPPGHVLPPPGLPPPHGHPPQHPVGIPQLGAPGAQPQFPGPPPAFMLPPPMSMQQQTAGQPRPLAPPAAAPAIPPAAAPATSPAAPAAPHATIYAAPATFNAQGKDNGAAEAEEPATGKKAGGGKEGKGKLPKAVPRQAAGQKWWDATLTEWPENDFRLFVGDLGNEVNDDVLTKAFQKYVSFQKAKVVREKRSNKTKGYGFVSFSDPIEGARVLREMQGKYIGNRPCKLRKSQWQERNDTSSKKRKTHVESNAPQKRGVLHK